MKSLPRNYLWAFIIFVAVLLWIGSGFLQDNNESSEVKIIENQDENLISIRAKEISSTDKIYYLTVRGRTEAEKRVILRPKATSSVIHKIDKGVFVNKGDVICSLDPENRSARLDEANANKKQLQLMKNRKIHLWCRNKVQIILSQNNNFLISLIFSFRKS